MSGPELPTRGGRAVRAVLLVYNDAHADARVLKTAHSLRAAGAQVRILAVARTHLGYPPTVERLADGIDLVRLREPAFIGYVPRLKRALSRGRAAARGLLKRPRLSASAPEPSTVPVGPSALSESSSALPAESSDALSPDSPSALPSASSNALPTESSSALPVESSTPPPSASPAPPPPASSPALPPPAVESGKSPARAAGPAWPSALLARLLDPVDRLARTLILVHYWAMAVRAAREWGPDVVHANDGNTLVPGRLVARRTGARLVYDSHELWRHRNVRNRPVGKHVEAVIERRVIARADGVITVSPSIARWLQRTYRLTTTPTLVRNIPALGEPVDPARGRLRELAGLRASDQVIAYGGRITTSRGLEETIQALRHLPERVHLVVLGYGDPGYLAALERRAELLGVRGRLHLVGKVAPDAVAQALADADLSVVYVRPTCLSYEFSLPNKLFEAIHGGLPIAAADLPDTRQIVTQHGVGEIFGLVRSPEEDADDASGSEAATDLEAREMAATMSRILADPQRYREAARAAAQVLTWQCEERELIALYRRVLG